MAPEKGMSDRTLRKKLKNLKYIRQSKNYLEDQDVEMSGELKGELGSRGGVYNSRTVDAELDFPIMSEIDLSKVQQDFSLEKLYQMGAIKAASKKEFMAATGKSEKEIEKYLTKKPSEEPRLAIKLKPEVSEDMMKKVVKVITNYPKAG